MPGYFSEGFCKKEHGFDTLILAGGKIAARQNHVTDCMLCSGIAEIYTVTDNILPYLYTGLEAKLCFH